MVRNDYDYENFLLYFDKSKKKKNVDRFSPFEIVEQILIYN